MNISQLEESFKKIDLNADYAFELLVSYFLDLDELPIFSCPLNIEYPLYRTRKNVNCCNFDTISDLSYPPKCLIKEFSRANKPLQSFLYLSDNIETNFTELMPHWLKEIPVGDIIFLTTGVWQIKQTINVAIILDLENQKMAENFPFQKFTLSEDDQNFFKFINSFFKQIGYNNNNIYKVTSAFCNTLLVYDRFNVKKLDGILYTSVHNPNGWNIALLPEVVESKKIVFMSAIKHFIVKSGYSNSKPIYNNIIEPIAATEINYENDKINW